MSILVLFHVFWGLDARMDGGHGDFWGHVYSLPAECQCLLRSDYDTMKVYNRKITIDTLASLSLCGCIHISSRQFKSMNKGSSRKR